MFDDIAISFEKKLNQAEVTWYTFIIIILRLTGLTNLDGLTLVSQIWDSLF